MTDFRSLITRRYAPLATAIAMIAVGAPSPARAADPLEKIVAVVNDEAISEDDLLGRLRLAMVAGNYPDTPEVREKLEPQVLRSLIDDQLRMQEARRLKLTVDKEEVDNEIKLTAEQNHQTLDQLKASLTKEGVPFSTFEKEITAQTAWRKVVQKEIRRRIDVTDAEIDSAYAKMMASIDKPQYLVAEIFLPVDSPGDDARVKKFATDLEEQIRNGASFPKLAQQFSQAAGAAQGGDMGQVQEGELPDELNQALVKMQPGQISDPIRTQAGYHILALRAKGDALAGDPNEALVHLKNILIPFTHQPSKEEVQQMMADAEKMRASLPNCAAVDEKGRRDGLAGDIGPAGQMTKIGQLQRGIGTIVASLQVNQMSQPIPTNDGIMMFMVCARKDPPRRQAPTREQVANQLYMERLDMQQQRYLSDLRSSGFVDVRV
jgi:peptidyl-prolyl cis-trans isomerase SurA